MTRPVTTTDKRATLTLMEEAFCQEYAMDPSNANEAAVRAGYKRRATKDSQRNLLQRPEILARIKEIKNEQFKRLHMEGDELLARVAETVRASFEDVAFVTDAGDPYIDMRKATPRFLRAVKSMKIEDFTDSRERDENGDVVAREVRRVSVELVDRLKASELLMKHLGLLSDKLEISVDESFAEMLMRATKGRE